MLQLRSCRSSLRQVVQGKDWQGARQGAKQWERTRNGAPEGNMDEDENHLDTTILEHDSNRPPTTLRHTALPWIQAFYLPH